MNIALQAYQLATDSPNKSDENKLYSVPSKKDFCEYLEETIIEKPLTDNKLRKADILLMQLLNILNMNIFTRDIETVAGHHLSNKDINLMDIDFDTKISTDELTKCWQGILVEYGSNGTINQDNVKMLYSAMKKAVPDLPDIDLIMLYNQINELLECSDIENGRNEDSKIHKNTFSKEHSLPSNKEPDSLTIKNDENERPKMQHSKQNGKDNSYDTSVARSDKKVQAKNQNNYNKLQEHLTMNPGGNNSRTQYCDLNPFSIKESFVTQQDKAASKIISSSSRNHQTSEIFEQLVDKMHIAFKGDAQQVSIRLKPDHLGNVLIKVVAEKDKMKAELFVENTQVRTLLKVHSLDFQNQIREQGYNISEINVYKMSDGLEMGAFNHQSSNNNHHQSRRPRLGFNKQETEDSKFFVDGYYERLGSASSVNYMV